MNIGVIQSCLLKFINKINQEYQLELNINMIFEYPNLDSLVRFLVSVYEDKLIKHFELTTTASKNVATAK